MHKAPLTTRQLACLTALFLIGNSSLVGGSGTVGRDSWAAALLALCAALPLVLLYARVSALYPGQALFGSMDAAFGRHIGWLLALPVTAYCFRVGALVLRDFPEFVRTTSLPKTPPLVFTLLLALLCAYLASLGPAGFARVAVLFAVMVFAIAVLTFLLLLPQMDVNHLRPALTATPARLAQNAGKLLISPFGESVLLLCLYAQGGDGKGKRRAFLSGTLLGGAYLAASVLRNILVLGAGNFQSVYYPSYSAVSLINIGDFLQRLEVFVAGYLLICDVIKIAAALYAVSLGLQRLFHLSSHRSAILPAALAMVPVALLAYPSTMAFYRHSPNEWRVAVPLQLTLPLLLWIVGEIRRVRGRA